jgi:hypothetical protein
MKDKSLFQTSLLAEFRVQTFAVSSNPTGNIKIGEMAGEAVKQTMIFL